jgi:endoglucanase
MRCISDLFKFNLFILFGFYFIIPTSFAQNTFNKGVNLTEWFQVSGARQIQFSKYTRKDFENIKSLGADVIRLPIDMTAMTSGDPEFQIDPLLYFSLDSAVTWAEENQLYLILDNHPLDPGPTSMAIAPMLKKIWIQLAEHYKNRSNYIVYELLNEPYNITTADWAQIEIEIINEIRTIDKVHTIIVGASQWNDYAELSLFPVFADANLIYTFHFYDPYLFTNQGATWPSPSLGSLAGVPFPYDAAKMPACPPDLKGTWVEGSLNTLYKDDGTVAKVKELIDIAATFKTSRNVEVYCGEFGVYSINSDTADRAFWHETVRTYLEEKDLSWTICDYHCGFGLFKKGSDGLFESDLNIPLINALGFNVPEQKPYIQKADSSDFFIYDDVIKSQILNTSAISSGVLNFYSNENVRAGKYCIEFSGVARYNKIGLDFIPNRDFSFLKADNYFLEFWLKGNDPSSIFDVRFIDSKTGAEDHPWRIIRTIDKNIVPFDNQWHYVKLPFSTFTEAGSMDPTWFSPKGLFDWTDIDRLEFVAEYDSLIGESLWFDQIAVSKTGIISQVSFPMKTLSENSLQAWPNPVNSNTTLRYTLETNCLIDLSIYSISGRRICSLINDFQVAGNHSVQFNGKDDNGNPLKQGIYLCRITSNKFSQTTKLIVTNTL